MNKSTKFANEIYRKQPNMNLLSTGLPSSSLKKNNRFKNKTNRKKRKKKKYSNNVLYNKQAMEKQLQHMIKVLERSASRKRNMVEISNNNINNP